MRKKIVFIGAGNIATRLATEFFNKGNDILCIYSKTKDSARILAEKLNSEWTTDLLYLPPEADIYFLTIPDQYIDEHIDKINFGRGIAIHCSGSLNIDIFQGKVENFGVFYPLQTFSKTRIINFNKVPVCIESNDNEILRVLKDVGNQISDDVRIIDSNSRKFLHIAAVFVCNFVNHMYSIADNILKMNNMQFDMLVPLMEETLKKAMVSEPQLAQTGPAIRNDENIVKKHLELLSFSQDFHDLYKMISSSISDFHEN